MFDQANYRVVFHELVDEYDCTDTLPDIVLGLYDKDWNLPISKAHKLTFSLEDGYVSSSDARFNLFFGKDYYDFAHENDNDELWDKYEEIADTTGHRIGGYAYFTQWDPRHDMEEEYLLLLQIDSVNEHICWGDAGVANIFIKREDLIKKDFSKVFYSWDCH